MPVSLNHREQRNRQRGSSRACEHGKSEKECSDIGGEGGGRRWREGEKAKFVLRVDERTIY